MNTGHSLTHIYEARFWLSRLVLSRAVSRPSYVKAHLRMPFACSHDGVTRQRFVGFWTPLFVQSQPLCGHCVVGMSLVLWV